MNKKIAQAVKSGQLIPLDKFIGEYSTKQQKKIDHRARYLQAAMAVRTIRRSLQLSQGKLAQKMNVKREFISRIESGQQNITLETLYKISSATGKQFHFTFS